MLAAVLWLALIWLCLGVGISLLIDPDRQFMKQTAAKHAVTANTVEIIVVLLWPALLYHVWRTLHGRRSKASRL